MPNLIEWLENNFSVGKPGPDHLFIKKWRNKIMNAVPLTDAQIEKAAEWWTATIDGPKYDKGVYDPVNEVCLLMPNPEVNEKQLAAFKVALRKQLEQGQEQFRHYPLLDVDYSPDKILSSAANEAGIDPSMFPWKTTMYFANGGVQVSVGHRGSIKEILL